MKGYLLDTNVLVALLWPAHQDHARAQLWFARHRAKGWATCALTECGFVRIVSNPAFSRDAVRPREAIDVLKANTASDDHQFWAGDVGIADSVAYAAFRLVGHQQVTDAYLLGLAIRHQGQLVTLDEGILSLTEVKSPERKAIALLA